MSHLKTANHQLLLLDLDGVMVVGESAGSGRSEDVRFLHPELPGLLLNKALKIILFTHRPYTDARQIQGALVNMGLPIVSCISAREMLVSALKQARFSELIKGGLSKKFGVEHVLKQFDLNPSQITLIDDRPEILKDVLAEGIGRGLLAPFEIRDSSLVSFDFSQALGILDGEIDTSSALVELDAVAKSVIDLPIILSIANNHSTSAGLMLRKLLRKIRQLVKNARG